MPRSKVVDIVNLKFVSSYLQAYSMNLKMCVGENDVK